jgi:hypothetical protein
MEGVGVKKRDIDTLVGYAIHDWWQVGDYSLCLRTTGPSGGEAHWDIQLDDDGGGTGNASHAYFGDIRLNDLLGHTITAARHEDESSYGVLLILEAGDKRGCIPIVHDHNGYYGFSYEVVPFVP